MKFKKLDYANHEREKKVKKYILIDINNEVQTGFTRLNHLPIKLNPFNRRLLHRDVWVEY